jgi:hypothetical protein
MSSVEDIEIQARELDFSSSGMGRHPTTALVADGTVLVNALDLADLAEPAQLVVCDHCGTVGCSSGGWAAFRRFGTGLVFIPRFFDMGAGEWETTEYGPPHFMNRRGMPFFSGGALDRLTTAVPFFGDLKRFPVLCGREAVLVMQWEAPEAILGRFPNVPTLHADLVSAVNPGDDAATLSALDALLSITYAAEQPVVVDDGEPVTFYLDRPGFPEWVPLARRGGEFLLSLGPEISFSICGSAQPGVADGPGPRWRSEPGR